MAQNVLAVKLEEMDAEISRLHSKILLGEQLSDVRLEEEITALRLEIELRGKCILRSLSETKMELAESLIEKFQMIQEELQTMHTSGCEQEILTAEYDIDFAILTAKHALLKALEAIQSENIQKREEEKQ